MEFIDHTGHIFSLPEYQNEPIGYEYDESPYIFWMDTEYTGKLSVNNYYIKPIRLLIKKSSIDDKQQIEASIKIENSNVYKLISPVTIQQKIEQGKMSIELNEYSDANTNSDFVTELHTDDLIFVDNLIDDKKYTYTSKDGKAYVYFGDVTGNDKDGYYGIIDGNNIPLNVSGDCFVMIPFYVIGITNVEGSWLTNILINIKYNNETRYCPITIGGTYIDEQEELIINGKNMGIYFPKDIIRAVYENSFYNNVANEAIYNQKLKEYLLNYMKFYGERGNFDSAIKGLKWFGYGDKIEIQRLMQTDNEIINQFVLDDFNIDSDMIHAFNNFKNSTYISLSIKENRETGEVEPFNFNNEFYGENKPILENLFDKVVECTYDEGDIPFYKPYYDYTFNELALKLTCLKYYYQKYFLPVHLNINRASITHQVFANDIKLYMDATAHITEPSIYVGDNNFTIRFPEYHSIYIHKQKHYIDDLFNEYSDTKYIADNTQSIRYEIDDNCMSIPIEFIPKHSEKEYYFNCNLLLLKNGEQIYESAFRFAHTEKTQYKNFVIYPKYLFEKLDVNYWLNQKFELLLYVNGTWFSYTFTVKVPEFIVEFGHLIYKYDYENFKQITGFDNNGKIQFNAKMWSPDLVTVDNAHYISDVTQYMKSALYINEKTIGEFGIYKYWYTYEGLTIIELLNCEKKTQFINSKLDDGTYSNEFTVINKLYDKPKVVYSSMHKSMQSFIEQYRETPNLPENDMLFNRVYLFDLVENNTFKPINYVSTSEKVQRNNKTSLNINIDGTLFECGDNTSNEVINMYKDIFNDNGDLNNKFEKYNIDGSTEVITNDHYDNFDIYIMHDTTQWYAVLISKDVIGKYKKSDLTLINKSVKISENYSIKLIRSDNKMLVNRLQYIPDNNAHVFNNKDVVVATVKSPNLPFILSKGTKWEFTPMSLGISNFVKETSSTNMAIMSIGDNLNYEPGYYNVDVYYTIDNYENHVYKNTSKILIKNDK